MKKFSEPAYDAVKKHCQVEVKIFFFSFNNFQSIEKFTITAFQHCTDVVCSIVEPKLKRRNNYILFFLKILSTISKELFSVAIHFCIAMEL